MDEYISKQKVLDYLNGYLHSLGEGGADTLLFDHGQRRALINSIQDISAVKAADVQPVKLAHWSINPDGYYPQCSNCGYEPPRELIRRNGDALIFPRYCPECGADTKREVR